MRGYQPDFMTVLKSILQAIDLFIVGEYWEEAIDLLKELASIYEEVLLDFKKLESTTST